MSNAAPSIKGSIFGLAIEDLRKLLAEGSISREEIERKLAPGDAAYLDEVIRTSGWYDVSVYGRLLDLLKDLVGKGRNEYLRERGMRSAENLLQGGLYQQMEYLNRTQIQSASTPEERARAFGRDLKLLSTLIGTILNFSSQTVKPDPDHPDRHIIEISEAEPYPEALCWSTEGFINRMAQQHGHPDLWTWERPTRDRIVFRMTRPA